jgi:hypothetical protein
VNPSDNTGARNTESVARACIFKRMFLLLGDWEQYPPCRPIPAFKIATNLVTLHSVNIGINIASLKRKEEWGFQFKILGIIWNRNCIIFTSKFFKNSRF